MLTIRKTTGGVWKHNDAIPSKGFSLGVDGENNFSFFLPNGQAPVATYNVSVITLIDDNTSTTYPTFTTATALQEQLRALGYVGFSEGGSVDPADLISADTPNNLSTGTDGKLLVDPFTQDTGGGLIPIAYGASGNSIGYLYHSTWATKSLSVGAEGHSRDAWLDGVDAQGQVRVVYLFRTTNAQPLKKISLINYFNNNNGDMTPVSGTGDRGIQNCKIYAVTSDITPTTTHGDLTGLQEVYSGDIAEITTEIIQTEITLSTAVDSYGFVIDGNSNYGHATTAGLRRAWAHK